MNGLSLFIDTTSNTLITGINSPSSINPLTLPIFYGDTIPVRVTLLNTIGTTLFGQNPYVIIPTTGLQLFLYLDDGTVGGTIYTQQITFTADPTTSFFSSTLALNTAALQALMAGSTIQTASLKIGYIQNGLPVTVFSQTVNIRVGLPAVNLAVAPGLTPLSVEVANATYVHIDGNPNNPGQGFRLISPAGKILYVSAIDNADGTATMVETPLN